LTHDIYLMAIMQYFFCAETWIWAEFSFLYLASF